MAAADTIKGSDLLVRSAVGIVLLALALVDIWFGGWAFTAMIALGIGVVFHEWCAMTGVGKRWMAAGLVMLAGCMMLAHFAQVGPALALLGFAIALLVVAQSLISAQSWRWLSAGLLYAGLPGIALIWLRQQPDGLALVLWTMGLVWATDIFAYFAGRSIGGPKIWTAISPKKTWAGLIGGMAAAALFSALFGWWRDWPQDWIVLTLLGAALAIVSQAGDFFESWLKRRAGVKDSGRLLPGHGGVMDRVDGLVPVSVVVALWVGITLPPAGANLV